ncbi:uncharacterized protein LOC130744137 [Lotus japonicus]|uniref:uncharacterized protein LOC130744137 n=1 Tax=Lotus japonicus TaxID=34305 RepID=UPI00258C809C|nr:uncharacterized protein LOC130744137 [Lotus japonicus]
MIEKIKDDKGREFVDDPNIARVLVAYFSELFTSSSPSGVQEATSLVANRVSQAHLEVLADPFTKEEVEDALFQMHPTKATCPDGFSALLSEALEASKEEAGCISDILATHERASGQVINLDKSMLSVSRNVPENSFHELKQMLNVKAVESFDKYLSLPTIFEIDGMIANFFLGGDASHKGLHWTKWSNLCRHIFEGGLGFCDFKAFNTSLVAKNWWRIYSRPDTLLAQVFKVVYFPRVFGMQRKVLDLAIRGLVSYALLGFFRRVGVGELVMDNNGWNKPLLHMLFCPVIVQRIVAVPLPIFQAEDALFWPFMVNGGYSSKSRYCFILSHRNECAPSSSRVVGLRPQLWNGFWKSDALPRCKEMAWRAIKGLLPVRKNLRSRGVNVDIACPFCGKKDVTTDHVLMLCPVVQSAWFASTMSLRVAGFQTLHDLVVMILELDEELMISHLQNWLYVLWEARNNAVFNDMPLTDERLLHCAYALMGVPDAVMQPQGRPAAVLPSVWRRPMQGTVKVNVDASVQNGGAAFFGMMARNYEGEVLAAATSNMVQVLSPKLA